MTGKDLITEYFENESGGEVLPELGEGATIEMPIEMPVEMPTEKIEDENPEAVGDAFIISFSETDLPDELSEEEVPEELEINYEEDPEEMQESVIADGNFIPGASEPIQEEVEEEPEDTNWADDRDTSKFVDYLREAWPHMIPQHNGNSISGCERALTFANKLNREISEAVRRDSGGDLDEVLDEIEDFRVKILQGMVQLKHRIGELKKKIREDGSQRKKSEDVSGEIVKDSSETEAMIKEATTAQIQLVITPFERAVTGILINSVVSAGHPFEEVYDYLKKKFKLTEREELAILQVTMDMGFPIFKDRGTIGSDDADGDPEKEGHGIDFIKNYFA